MKDKINLKIKNIKDYQDKEPKCTNVYLLSIIPYETLEEGQYCEFTIPRGISIRALRSTLYGKIRRFNMHLVHRDKPKRKFFTRVNKKTRVFEIFRGFDNDN